jgi:hypothetical protein
MHIRSLLCSGAALVLAATQVPAPASAHEYAGRSTADGAAYARLPLSFEPNHGQADKQVDFLARGRGYTLFLTPAEAVLSVRSSTPEAETRTLRMQLDGADAVAAAALEELPGRVNYLVGNDPSAWLADVPTFGRVRYAGVYPGVDLEYYGHQGQLEYDFIVTPGADPARIALAFDGADAVSVDADGDLVLQSGGAEVRQARPYIYQQIDGQRSRIDGGFAIDDSGRVHFDIGAFDRTQTLVIDPLLEYSTFLGGSGDENYWGGVVSGGIAVDAKGAA